VKEHPNWITIVLKIAAVYHLLWGIMLAMFTNQIFDWLGVPPVNYPHYVQFIGFNAIAFGIGYYISASDPYKFWPILLVGFMVKLFATFYSFYLLFLGEFLMSVLILVGINQFIWLPFLAVILYKAAYYNQNTYEAEGLQLSFSQAVHFLKSNTNETVAEMNEKWPLLLIFLRHFGCTFCRQTLTELQFKRADLESRGYKIILVHQSSEAEAAEFLKKYKLDDLIRISDPANELYEAFGINRAKFFQIFNPISIIKAFYYGLIKKHFIGKLKGDGFRLAGLVAIKNGKIILHQRQRTASEPMNWRNAETCLQETA
jgi:peroxiredoxin